VLGVPGYRGDGPESHLLNIFPMQELRNRCINFPRAERPELRERSNVSTPKCYEPDPLLGRIAAFGGR
jgi:hypothetical protein